MQPGFGHERAAPTAVPVLCTLLAISFTLGLALPLVSGPGAESSAVFHDGPVTVVWGVIIVASALIGAIGSTRAPLAVGLAGGAGAVAAGYAALLAVTDFKVVDGAGGLDSTIGYGAGFPFLVAAACVGLALLVVVWTAGGWRGPRIDAALAVFGVIAALAPAATAIPAPGSGATFAQWNALAFDGAIGASLLGWLAISAAAGVIGFASATRRGVGLALGAWLPWAWLILATLAELDTDGGGGIGVSSVLSTKVHPILPIGLAVEGLIVLIAIVASSSNRSPAVAPPAGPAAPAPTPPIATAAVPAAQVAPTAGEWWAAAAPSSVPPVPKFPAPSRVPSSPALRSVPADEGDATVQRQSGVSGALRLTFDDGSSVVVDRTTYLGRDPASNDSQAIHHAVADATFSISKTHARLRREGDGWWIDDLGSVNGTTVGTLVVAADGATGSRPIRPPVTVRLGERTMSIGTA